MSLLVAYTSSLQSSRRTFFLALGLVVLALLVLSVLFMTTLVGAGYQMPHQHMLQLGAHLLARTQYTQGGGPALP